MNRYLSLRPALVLLLLALAAGASGLATSKLFESLETISATEMLSQKPIHVSQRIFISGKCTIHLYGWFTDRPGFGGADEYLKILKVDTILASSSDTVSLVATGAAQKNAVEGVWEIQVPNAGVLTATIHSYQIPSPNVKQANAFMSCENGILFKMPGLLFIVSISLGTIGFFILIAIIIQRLFVRK